MTAMNVNPDLIDGAFRVSLCRDSVQEELDLFLTVLKNEILPRRR